MANPNEYLVFEADQDTSNPDVVWRSSIDQILGDNVTSVLVRRARTLGEDAILRLADVVVLDRVAIVAGSRA